MESFYWAIIKYGSQMEGWWGIAICSYESDACHVNSQPKQLILRFAFMKLKILNFVQSSALNLFLVSEDNKSFCLHLPGGCGKPRWSCVIKLDERLAFYQWDMKSNQVKWVLRSQLISLGNIRLHYTVTTPNSSQLIQLWLRRGPGTGWHGTWSSLPLRRSCLVKLRYSTLRGEF